MIMNRWAFLLLMATALPQPARADVHRARGTLGVQLTIISQCTTQYTLFGPAAISPISVICEPGATPFTTFSSILYNVATTPGAAGSKSQDVAANGTAPGQGDSATAPTSPVFAADTTVTTSDGTVPDAPSALQHTTSLVTTDAAQRTASHATEIVHVTF
ncbi:hypothetical protein CDEF62S_05534 [Castellaniella defragrans]